MLALVYANRLKAGLDMIIAETQTGFMKKRHISSNIRLILDVLDYANEVNTEAVILFLDFYKAFDTIEHNFRFQSLKVFGFGNNFVDIVCMFYRDIYSSVLINLNTSKRFQINRGVRQGCPISPFLFLLVTELLSISIVNNEKFEGISIFGRELQISQLADDTTLFLKDKNQLLNIIILINQFSHASGLRLNVSKCEILSLHNSNDSTIENIPVKTCVKYLGIFVTKDLTARQHLNFANRLKKTKSIFNTWLQRDLSVLGRVLLSKAEGLSRLVYPALSLFVSEPTTTQVNTFFLDFIWKNKSHKLKKHVLSNSKAEGGLEVLDFIDTVNTFKVNWLRKCLRNPDSIWFFIPNHIFNKIGGLFFLLKCNFLPNRLPIKLSKFHQQTLLAWKLAFVHNFSPHKAFLWNNSNILIRNKSLFLPKWFERGIIHILHLFDNAGNMLSYEHFMSVHSFPVLSREFINVTRAIPIELIQLIKSHLSYSEYKTSQPVLMLNGIELTDRRCNNKHIRQCFQRMNRVVPRGKFYWRSQIEDINWRRAWLLPHK
uniref:Reverse transcriptase domain-containing protein n=1 Tax=Sparus aurata TaxID=8175 RepID=A0A671UBE6_SPAAU